MGEQNAFPSTRWSLVLAAGAKRDVDKNAQAALNELCLAYWMPLYAYACRRVASIDEAQDLTQDFFAHLLQKESLAAADRLRGKFRTFLLTSFQYFVINQWEKRRALKRGGNVQTIALDFDSMASSAFHISCNEKPEKTFEREWATMLLGRALSALRAEAEQNGKLTQFEALKPLLAGNTTGDSAKVADELGMTEGAVRVAAHRLRQRFRELLRHQILQTVASPEDVEQEIQDLFSALES